MWGPILTLLKFAGVLVSGAAAIVAATPERSSARPPKRLPTSRFARVLRTLFSKQSAVRWAIFGFVVALLSTFAETLKTKAETSESQRTAERARINTSNQVWIAQKSLDSLERLLTRFDTVSVSIKYQIDPQCVIFAQLYKTLSALNYSAPKPEPRIISRGPVSGYWTLHTAENVPIEVHLDQSLDFRTWTFYGLDANVLASFIGVNNNSITNQAFQCIYSPGFDIEIFSAKRAYILNLWPLRGSIDESFAPDLLLQVTNLIRSPQITYDCMDRHIFIFVGFDTPKLASALLQKRQSSTFWNASQLAARIVYSPQQRHVPAA